MSLAASFFAPRQEAASQNFSNPDGWISRSAAEPVFAGVQVNEQIALTVTAVYRAVALISEAVAGLPLDVFRRQGEDRIEEPGHPVAELFRSPNPLMNSVDLRTAEQAHALQYGGAYMEIQRNNRGDAPRGLWPLLPDRTSIEKDINDESVLRYRSVISGKHYEFAPENVLHIRGLSFDGIRGYSPLQLARQGIGLALGLEQFGAKFFGNDAKSGGILSHPSELSPDAHRRIKESWVAQGGLENAHYPKVIEEGMTFTPTTVSPEDSQFLATRTFQVEEVARLYGVPLHMLQSQSKTTSWGSGIAQMSLGFLIYTIAPWLTRWEQEINRKLFTPAERAAGFYAKHNVNALLRADAESRARFYTAALSRATGWMGRDEVRRLEDLNPDGIENHGPSSPVSQPVEPAPYQEPEDDGE